MKFKIKKVAVLGSGVMGSGIACHLANIGLDVIMIDILPKDLKNNNNKSERDSIAFQSLQKIAKTKPSPLYKKEFINRIEVGNLEDDLQRVAEVDWIIEVVVENLDIKKQLFEKVDKIRKKGILISSNTSSIPINMLADGRSDDFKKHFLGTHFFNPPRYLRLLELIPHTATDPKVLEFFNYFGETYLGKQTVLCKDTPAFIANRIGMMSLTKLMQLTDKYKFKIEEVDALTGSIIGWPSTATYRLQDLIGIDTSAKVSEFIMSSVKNDEFIDMIKKEPMPKYMKFLFDNKFLGLKTGKGFYEKTNNRDENGQTIINALNLENLQYEPSIKARLNIYKTAKSIENISKKMQILLNGEDRENLFYQDYFSALLSYVSNRIPEVSDEYYSIDDAMKAGYNWKMGPFEYWDAIGFKEGVQWIEKKGLKLAQWVKDLEKTSFTTFYIYENGIRKFFNRQTKKYEELPSAKNFTILDAYRNQKPVLTNSECVVHDLGDGVMCFEFTSKSNSLGDGIVNGLIETITKADQEGWNGLVIGNNADNFAVGANLMAIGMLAGQQEFDMLNMVVNQFQQLMMLIKTSKIPVVVATQGYVFGGGCEIAMHANAGIFAAESYIGLVEVGVGLIPAGGGTKEMAIKISDKLFEGDVNMPTLIEHFKTIAMASVATSAYEAYDYHYLDPKKDFVCLNSLTNITKAKEKVLELAKDFVPPSPRNDIKVLGRSGLATLQTAIHEFRLGNFISEYDAEISNKLAYVLCGGDLTGTQSVTEQYLLDLEREAFLSLLGKQKTLERIQYLLLNNKPLRN